MQNTAPENTSPDNTLPGNTAQEHHIQITATNINVYYNGSTSGYFGPKLQTDNTTFNLTAGLSFTYSTTIPNKLQEAHGIDKITVLTPGFTITSVTPDLPAQVAPGSNVKVTLNIMPPDSDYTGPIDYAIYTSY